MSFGFGGFQTLFQIINKSSSDLFVPLGSGEFEGDVDALSQGLYLLVTQSNALKEAHYPVSAAGLYSGTQLDFSASVEFDALPNVGEYHSVGISRAGLPTPTRYNIQVKSDGHVYCGNTDTGATMAGGTRYEIRQLYKTGTNGYVRNYLDGVLIWSATGDTTTDAVYCYATHGASAGNYLDMWFPRVSLRLG